MRQKAVKGPGLVHYQLDMQAAFPVAVLYFLMSTVMSALLKGFECILAYTVPLLHCLKNIHAFSPFQSLILPFPAGAAASSLPLPAAAFAAELLFRRSQNEKNNSFLFLSAARG